MSILGIRSHFSVGQSTLSPKQIVLIAKEKGYDTVGLCDDYTVAGMTELVKTCKAEEMNYIIGASLSIYDDASERTKQRPNYALKCFVKSEQGLKNLFNLISMAYDKDHFYYTPRLDLVDIVSTSCDGLIFTTGDVKSIFEFESWKADLKILSEHVDSSNDVDLCFEQCGINQPYFLRVVKEVELARKDYDWPLIVTQPVFYREGADEVRDIASAVVNNRDPNHSLAPKPFCRDFKIVGRDDWNDYIGLTGLDDKSEDLIDSIHYTWEKQDMSLPKLAVDEFAELVRLCKDGWSERLHTKVFGETLDASRLSEYKDRLKYELSIIKSMGFSAYFLLVHYVVNYSKDNNILVGPARGSAAGSLVAYLLKITDVDPLRFGLIFERFLNPDRLDYPDIDLDFMSSRRGEIIDHLIDKFGEEHVSGIANYNTLASASALRDVARVSKLPPHEYDCSKLVPKEHGQSVKLEDAAEIVTAIEQFALKYPKHWSYACDLQGLIKATGQHAAGIVVAGEPIRNRAAVYGNKEYPVACWDKRVVEDWGLIKLDVLGLSTLDIIYLAVKKANAAGKRVDLWSIPLDDKATLDVFAKGRTKGVFQFEGGLARSLCREIAVAGDFHFNDIVAINALNRPGPLDAGLTDKYVKIRQGKFVPEYPHPKAEPALASTHSVITYQEQVMQIARDLCGFTMAESDHLRKAVSKKDPVKMKEMSEQFVSGATAGWTTVELEDGSRVTYHNAQKIKCKDGVSRTILEVIENDAEIA